MSPQPQEGKVRTSSPILAAARVLAAVTALAALLMVLPSPAGAQTTHPFLGKIELANGSRPQPSGVDSEGNIIVWLEQEEEVAKFDANGNPVNFSGLGTNILDGRGGFECPAVASDCDRVPSNGFGVGAPDYEQNDGRVVVVDQSHGPQAGYIYVNNVKEAGGGEVDVFAPSGKFLGTINQGQAFPHSDPNGRACGGIGISSIGQVFINHPANCGENHTDVYGPTASGVPSEMPFLGQIHPDFQGPIVFLDAAFDFVVGDTEFLYAFGAGASDWVKYPKAEFTSQNEISVPIDFSPTQCRCGVDSGPFEHGGVGYTVGAVDPADRHIYLAGDFAEGETMQEWDPDNHKIGPDFGTLHLPRTISIQGIAFDRSGGPTEGNIYVQGGNNQLAVFGPPVVIPDVHYDTITPLHTTAHVEATVDPLGAGPVTECEVEYGTDVTYGNSVPCGPSTPYSGSSPTQVSAEIPGLSAEGDYHYRVSATNGNGTYPAPDQTFHTHAVLDAVTEPATSIDLHSATLNGKLNPDGLPTTYHFEYGIDTAYRQKTANLSAGSGSGQISVTPTQIANLQPGRTYHFRLVAQNALGISRANDQTFTVASSPAISGVYANNVTETSAVVHATIDTFESDTSYHFEYGTTEEFGSVAPVPDGAIQASATEQPVQVQLNGLTSGATYFFRVVATNQWGTTVGQKATFSFFPPNCPNSHIRQVTASNYLPDCRAYELVSPGDAGAVTLLPGDSYSGRYKAFFLDVVTDPHFKAPPPNARGLASNPPRFGYLGALGGVTGTDPPNTLLDRYVATRTSTGWVTTYPGLKGNEVVLEAKPRCDLTMTICIDYDAGDPFGAGTFSDPTPHVWNVDGESLGRWPTNLSVVPNVKNYINQETGEITGDEKPSPDFSHYILTSRDVVFTAGGISGAPGSAYDNDVRNRSIQVVSKLPGGGPIPQDAGGPKEFIKLPAVSDDGSHILMSSLAPGETTHLYMRVDDTVTYDVSQGLGAKFVAMTTDGSKVVFTSKYQLTPDDTDSSVDMYEWSENTDSVVRVSQGNGNGDTDSCNTGWISGCGVEPIIGERPELDNVISPGTGDAYFYSPEQLDPNNPGVLNERNLYDYRDGKVQYVATFPGNTRVYRSQISPDGSHAAFLTDARLTGYDNQGWREMYTYDANTGTVRCASCIPDGSPPKIMRFEPPGFRAINKTADVLASESGPFMANDGRVAFTTSDALVPQDTDGVEDVYEFVDSRPRLISSGTSQRSVFEGNAIYPPAYTGLESFSADGIDLYFSTYDTLAPQDHNGPFIKFYDARTNGGFPISPPLQPCVAADECHGTGSATPGEPQIGTGANLGGGGNELTAPKRKAKKGRRGRKKACARKCRRHRARHRHRHAARLESRNG
jgi:hypothetical protein